MSRHHHKLAGKAWQIARLRCFERAGWRCQRCFKSGRLEAHHKVRLEAGGAPFDPANLEVLCRACHTAEHRGDREVPGRAAWRRLVADMLE